MTEQTMPTLGQHIAHLRHRRGLTQVELAVEVGVIRTTVARWETNTQRPSARQFIRAVNVLIPPPIRGAS